MSVRGLVPASAVFEIEDQRGIVRSRECITVHAHPLSGGHFRSNAVAEQRNAVITGLRNLFAAFCIGPHSVTGVGYFTHNRHYSDIKQIPDASAGQMGMAKAYHR